MPKTVNIKLKKYVLIDTTILLLILKVPQMGVIDKSKDEYKEALEELKRKRKNKETVYLPIATIIETGNHIGQISDGNKRTSCANAFIKLIKTALDKNNPFTVLKKMQLENLAEWIDNFPEYAKAEVGFGDLSIIEDCNELSKEHKTAEVYIWTSDSDFDDNTEQLSERAKRLRKSKQHLASYSCKP